MKNKLCYMDMTYKRQKRTGLVFLIIAICLFLVTLVTVAIYESNIIKSESSSITSFLLRYKDNSYFKTPQTENNTEIGATVERIARQVKNLTKNNFYEEQRAVVVNVESSNPETAVRQASFMPPQYREDSIESDPYYDFPYDYDQRQPIDTNQDDYQQQQQPYGADNKYNGDSSVWSSSEEDEEGRAVNNRPYDLSRHWNFAKEAPMNDDDRTNRKMLPISPDRQHIQGYMPFIDENLHGHYNPIDERRPLQTQASKYQKLITKPTAITKKEENQESTLVTVLKSLKQMWDIYSALISAWNSINDYRERQVQELHKKQDEKLKLTSRINSKKPPTIEHDKSAQRNQTKKTKTTTAIPLTSSTSKILTTEARDQEKHGSVEPRNLKGDIANSGLNLRSKRDADAGNDVSEARYIKGDPLKGYYDFVITEGSYKFWAVFQVGTAILIIYSTFAAIYYSKVNPLVGDYDYTDYLGGGRSLSGGDDDFVDDSDSSLTSSKSILNDLAPRTAHTLKFILDAIDKVPNDHSNLSKDA